MRAVIMRRLPAQQVDESHVGELDPLGSSDEVEVDVRVGVLLPDKGQRDDLAGCSGLLARSGRPRYGARRWPHAAA